MAKELLPIVLSCVVWGPVHSGYAVEFKCDNQSVVDSVNKGSSKEPMTMHLFQCLWFFSTYFGITVTVSHIPGVVNVATDQLSRKKSAELNFFRQILTPPVFRWQLQHHYWNFYHLRCRTWLHRSLHSTSSGPLTHCTCPFVNCQHNVMQAPQLHCI